MKNLLSITRNQTINKGKQLMEKFNFNEFIDIESFGLWHPAAQIAAMIIACFLALVMLAFVTFVIGVLGTLGVIVIFGIGVGTLLSDIINRNH